jgi:hypothetical protein
MSTIHQQAQQMHDQLMQSLAIGVVALTSSGGTPKAVTNSRDDSCLPTSKSAPNSHDAPLPRPVVRALYQLQRNTPGDVLSLRAWFRKIEYVETLPQLRTVDMELMEPRLQLATCVLQRHDLVDQLCKWVVYRPPADASPDQRAVPRAAARLLLFLCELDCSLAQENRLLVRCVCKWIVPALGGMCDLQIVTDVYLLIYLLLMQDRIAPLEAEVDCLVSSGCMAHLETLLTQVCTAPSTATGRGRSHWRHAVRVAQGAAVKVLGALTFLEAPRFARLVTSRPSLLVELCHLARTGHRTLQTCLFRVLGNCASEVDALTKHGVVHLLVASFAEMYEAVPDAAGDLEVSHSFAAASLALCCVDRIVQAASTRQRQLLRDDPLLGLVGALHAMSSFCVAHLVAPEHELAVEILDLLPSAPVATCAPGGGLDVAQAVPAATCSCRHKRGKGHGGPLTGITGENFAPARGSRQLVLAHTAAQVAGHAP